MKIDCYLSHGCRSEDALRANLTAAIERAGIKARVGVHRISAEEALSRGLSGSPSVFINGKELQPLGTAGFS